MKIRYSYNGKLVILHGFFQRAYVVAPSLLVGGHTGGQVAYPVALVEFEDGTFENANPKLLFRFSDNKDYTLHKGKRVRIEDVEKRLMRGCEND